MSQSETRMVRLAMVSAAVLCFLPQTASAAQVTSSIGVGITIDSSGKRPATRTRLIVPGAVTKAVPETSYTWNAAAVSVKRAGFKQARRMEQSPALYWFQAKRQDASFRIAVSVASGRIAKIIRA